MRINKNSMVLASIAIGGMLIGNAIVSAFATDSAPDRQAGATAYCAGWADAHSVHWHETPETPDGFLCVTDLYPECHGWRSDNVCITYVPWTYLNK